MLSQFIFTILQEISLSSLPALIYNNIDEAFSSRQFLSINEVGLVFGDENFDKEIMHLENLYSLSYFDKQPPLPKFRAMGDDERLFVIVPEHRNGIEPRNHSGILPMIVEY